MAQRFKADQVVDVQCRGEDVTVQGLVDKLHLNSGWKGLEEAAEKLLEGRVSFLPENARGRLTRVKHGLLIWALSDRPEARVQWEIITRSAENPRLRDRDRYVEALWASLRSEGANADLERMIRNRLNALETYRSAVFTWFLRRFDLGAAFRTRTSRRKAFILQWVLPPLVVAASALVLGIFGFEPEASVAGLVVFPVIALAGWSAARPAPFGTFIQALLPRLGAGVVLGYLFLAAAPDLVRLIVGWGRPPAAHWIVVAVVLGAAWAYAAFHIGSRVHPTPSGGVLALRALQTVWYAVAYAAGGLVFLSPLLFAGPFLASLDASAPVGPPGAHSAALTATIALALGLILELAWEEKPLTEPL